MATNHSTDSSNLVGRISKKEKLLAYSALAAMVALTIFALTFAGQLKTAYSVSEFLPPGHELLKADLETRRKFFLDENQPLLITLDLKKGDWLETDRLSRLAQATESFRAINGVKDSLSLGTVPSASRSNDEMVIGSLLKVTTEQSRRDHVRNDRFLTPTLISENMRRSLVVISIDESISLDRTTEIMATVRGTLEKSVPEAKVSVGGVPAIQTRLTDLVKSELLRFMGLGLVASCLTLLLVFSSLWSTLVPFVAIIVTNIFVLGFMAVCGFSMTVLAVTIPILVAITVLSLCTHTMLRFVEDANHFHAVSGRLKSRWTVKTELIWHTFATLLMPNLLTSVTTAFGFATLVVTDVPVIREFGIAMAASVMISWVATSVVVGPMLMLLPIPVARPWILRQAEWVDWVFRFRRSVTVSVIAGCAIMVWIGQDLRWSARLFDDLPEKEEARVATEEIDRGLGGTIPMEIVISVPKIDSPWNDPQALSKLDRVLGSLRKHDEVGSALGLPDLLRQSLGDPRAELPKTRAAVAESWFLLGMSEPNPVKKFLTADGEETRISLRLRDEPSDRLERLMRNLLADVRSAFPDAKVSSAGMATTVHTLNNDLSRELLMGFWDALVVITVLLYFVFRSWRWTFMAMLPNLVPAAVLVGILALAQTPIKPGVALVFSIALGIAFNNTVYMLQRLKQLMDQSGKSAAEEIRLTLRLEGNPCLISSLCVIAGFGIFLLSEFGINRTFGTYMVISLGFGLIGDLALLPALIRWCPWILGSTQNVVPANLKVSTVIPVTDLAPIAPVAAIQEIQVMTSTPASEEKSVLPRAAASIALLFTLLAPTSYAFAAANASAILKEVEKRMSSKDEAAVIKMKVVESNGSAKEREVLIKRKSGGKSQVLVRLKAPSDVSGVALLSVAQGGKEDQWLYMPSQKKARRVVAGNKSQKFLDTEFNLEDFSAGTYARFDNKVVKEERAPSASVAVIESKAKDDSTSYSKILTWVDMASYQVQKSEYYDKEGKLLKTMVFRDYKKFGNTWRAQSIEVRNMQNQRSTILKVAGLKLNSGLTDREFTQSALESGD